MAYQQIWWCDKHDTCCVEPPTIDCPEEIDDECVIVEKVLVDVGERYSLNVEAIREAVFARGTLSFLPSIMITEVIAVLGLDEKRNPHREEEE